MYYHTSMLQTNGIPLLNNKSQTINTFANYIYSTITTNKCSFVLTNILLGQLLAILSVVNGILSQRIETKHKVVTPLLMTSTYYFLLGVIWIIYNKFSFQRLRLVYFLITFIDSQANFINIFVFTFIQFEFPFIINFCSVIWTCLFTWLFITKYQYKSSHVIGIFIALLGVIITLYGTFNSMSDVNKLFSNNVKGFGLCLVTSLLYSINGILQEKYLTSNDEIFEFFPWMGLIGSIVSFIESFWFKEISKIGNEYIIDSTVVLLWCGFAGSLALFTSITPFFISRCSASMFNFSLASTIFWSAVVNSIVNNERSAKSILFLIGFVLIIVGLLVFYLKKMKGEFIIEDIATFDTANDVNTRGFIMNDVMSEVSDCDVGIIDEDIDDD